MSTLTRIRLPLEHDVTPALQGIVPSRRRRWGGLDDIGQLTHPHQEKFSLQILYDPRRPRKRDSAKGRWGLTISAARISTPAGKLSLQVLYPPSAARIVPWRKRTMGVPISPSADDDRNREKISLQVHTPRRVQRPGFHSDTSLPGSPRQNSSLSLEGSGSSQRLCQAPRCRKHGELLELLHYRSCLLTITSATVPLT